MSAVRDLQCPFLLNTINKCQLGKPSLTFLGHVVDSRGISIPTERVEAIKRFPVPTTPKELERFLGMCAFSPLCKTRVWENGTANTTQEHSRQKDFEEAWNPVHDRAFCATKEAIANATLLVHPLPKLRQRSGAGVSSLTMPNVVTRPLKGNYSQFRMR